MYLPLAGFIILLNRSLRFKFPRQRLLWPCLYIILLIGLGAKAFSYQYYFRSPVAFWQKAQKDSPNSVVCNMMLAMNTNDEQQAKKLFNKAFSLNSNQRYLNLRYAVFLFNKRDYDQSSIFLQKELEVSGTFECYYYLMLISLAKEDINNALVYSNLFLIKNPDFDFAESGKFLFDRKFLLSNSEAFSNFVASPYRRQNVCNKQ